MLDLVLSIGLNFRDIMIVDYVEVWISYIVKKVLIFLLLK